MMGDAVIQEALTSGTDLREYSQKLEQKLKRVSFFNMIIAFSALLEI